MKYPEKQFVMIDYENLQPDHLEILPPELFSIYIFLGVDQTSLKQRILENLPKDQMNIHFIQVCHRGRNALDLHIAYYLGLLIKENKLSYYYIFSKDKGYDPLVRYLKNNLICCRRITRMSHIPYVRYAFKVGKSSYDLIVENLKCSKLARPKTIHALKNAIASFFTYQVDAEFVDDVIMMLKKDKIISVEGYRIYYFL